MGKLAIIGGTGLVALQGLQIVRREVVHTPYGEPSGALTHGVLQGTEVVFLARHGYGHTIPPHKINYRANLWALKQVGVDKVIAIAAVGGIARNTPPQQLVLPDQIIDYTWSRQNTYFEDDLLEVTHVDFTWPYCRVLREALIQAAANAGLPIVASGTYGATQGPRLETAAEIQRLERDGCTLVGMTGMPEAALAKELELCYATCAVVANWAAGKSEEEITLPQIQYHLSQGMQQVVILLQNVVRLL